jgi:hypothetical protein
MNSLRQFLPVPLLCFMSVLSDREAGPLVLCDKEHLELTLLRWRFMIPFRGYYSFCTAGKSRTPPEYILSWLGAGMLLKALQLVPA